MMSPAPGERVQRFVGDRVCFTVRDAETGTRKGWKAFLRTNLGRGSRLRREIIEGRTRGAALAGGSWRDIPMQAGPGGWHIEVALPETGYFKAKAYVMDGRGWQQWPFGPDVGIAVHPDYSRSGNTIYCAFTRMFGPGREAAKALPAEPAIRRLDEAGYTVIPPSGKLRDLKNALPHVVGVLGCRVLHLLPIHPTPTTYARFGRFGSPYAALDLTAIDPALVEFDRRTTGVDQFRELTYATHLLGARVFLDIVINHTGWGSVLQENHPEWFLREPNGTFVSPGAWGTVWEDLVELEHAHVALWDELAEMFLVWCRRGVDGFRCDAGYKVPTAAWEYIIARVREEYPDTLFLLEGLGGAWETTEALLLEGGMQWAYSELFQNYSPLEVSGYLDHALKQSGRSGLLVHYSETHDNERLAARGRAWSLLRNRLCALASSSGGYGFTCGVEWLAAERIRVHESRGMAWGAADNIVAELSRLNALLLEHPCFFDGATVERLSSPGSSVLALWRRSAEGKDEVLVLVNTDARANGAVELPAGQFGTLGSWTDLLGQAPPRTASAGDDRLRVEVAAAGAYCLARHPEPIGLRGEEYRQVRARAAWATQAMCHALPVVHIGSVDWTGLAQTVDLSPHAFLSALSRAKDVATRASEDGKSFKLDDKWLARALEAEVVSAAYPRVIHWTRDDSRRVVPVPPGHWLLIEDTVPFRARLTLQDGSPPANVTSIAAAQRQAACFPPRTAGATGTLLVERYAEDHREVAGEILFLDSEPAELPRVVPASSVLPDDLVLLTNGRGAMARMCVDLGRVLSKYDCVLGANLHPSVPVDRHVFAKRIRVWVDADGFLSPLNSSNLARFAPGPPATWSFVANAGDGRTVQVGVSARMLPDRNTVVFRFTRPSAADAAGIQLPAAANVRLTVRLDIEDRNFHWETRRNGGGEHHFRTHVHTLSEGGPAGFEFTPSADRRLRVTASSGAYHPQPEWSENIPHPVEQSRGLTGSGDAFSPGWFELPLPKGAETWLTVSAEAEDAIAAIAGLGPLDADLSESLDRVTATYLEEQLKAAELPGENISPEPIPNPPPGRTSSRESLISPPDPGPAVVFAERLEHATRAFLVRRGDGKTVIAGYPWFLDWGRDTFICARGLLGAGMADEVRRIVLTFATFEQDGTLPNIIHGEDASNRDTSDAPLLFGLLCSELAAAGHADLYATPVGKAGRKVADVLRSIAQNYARGTPNGIRMDPDSGLIWSPSHFTWMDTNYPACSPRQGYPVEIQALWVRLLEQVAALPGSTPGLDCDGTARRARKHFEKFFWREADGYYADVLLSGPGQPAAAAVVDDALRPNCLFAITLGLAAGDRARRCVEMIRRWLPVPGALRSLAPLRVAVPLPNIGNHGQPLNDPHRPYWGRYEGDEDTRRKPAYHNGTAWTWTFPVFCEAVARAWDFAPDAVAAARAYLFSIQRLMMRGCLGHLPEIVDGDSPHQQRGCDAQAWAATEALRVCKLLG